jgi:hypothetical protein
MVGFKAQGYWGSSTVCCATSAQNRITPGILDGGHNRTRGRGAFDEDELILKTGVHILNAYNAGTRCQMVDAGGCDSSPLLVAHTVKLVQGVGDVLYTSIAGHRDREGSLEWLNHSGV